MVAAIQETSGTVLTTPMSQFFGRPVAVAAPELLPSKEAAAAATKPRAAPAIPVQELPDVDVKPKRKQPFKQSPVGVAPGVRPLQPPPAGTNETSKAQKQQQQSEEVPVEVPTLPIHTRQPTNPSALQPPQTLTNKTAQQKPPAAAKNATAYTPVPRKVAANYTTVPNPDRLAVTWAAAPVCKFKADGENAVPDSEGRLWG
jgi:hypothetical protein